MDKLGLIQKAYNGFFNCSLSNQLPALLQGFELETQPGLVLLGSVA